MWWAHPLPCATYRLRTVVKVCTLGVLTLGLVSSSLFLIPFMLTCSMMRFLSLLLLGLCACSAVVVLRLSLRLSWCPMLWVRLVRRMWCMYCCLCYMGVWYENVRVRWSRKCWCGVRGSVVAVSAYMVGTCGSGVLSSAGDMIEMSVVRGVGGVCDMCRYLARGGSLGGEWVRGLVLDFTNSGGTSGKWDMFLRFGCGGVGGVGESCLSA